MKPSNRQDVEEAICAGKNALRTIDEMIDVLQKANRWATWDLFGGGLVTDLVKHSHLDRCRTLASSLERELKRLQRELKDISDFSASGLNIGRILTFADLIFDDFFSDLAVKSKIRSAQNQLRDLQNQLAQFINALERKKLE